MARITSRRGVSGSSRRAAVSFRDANMSSWSMDTIVHDGQRPPPVNSAAPRRALAPRFAAHDRATRSLLSRTPSDTSGSTDHLDIGLQRSCRHGVVDGAHNASDLLDQEPKHEQYARGGDHRAHPFPGRTVELPRALPVQFSERSQPPSSCPRRSATSRRAGTATIGRSSISDAADHGSSIHVGIWSLVPPTNTVASAAPRRTRR